MSDCPTEDQLRRLLAGSPDPVERPDVRAHLSGCPECRLRLAALAGNAGMEATGGTRAAAATMAADLTVATGTHISTASGFAPPSTLLEPNGDESGTTTLPTTYSAPSVEEVSTECDPGMATLPVGVLPDLDETLPYLPASSGAAASACWTRESPGSGPRPTRRRASASTCWCRPAPRRRSDGSSPPSRRASRSWASSAAAAWGSSTRPASAGSTGSSP